MYDKFLPDINLKNRFYSANSGVNLKSLIRKNALKYFNDNRINVTSIKDNDEDVTINTSCGIFSISIKNETPNAVRVYGLTNNSIKRFRNEIWLTKSVFDFPVLSVVHSDDYFETHPSNFYIIITPNSLDISPDIFNGGNEEDEFIDSSDYMNLKHSAYNLAKERQFLKKELPEYNRIIDYIKHDLSESIIRSIWNYHETHGTQITDGQETRLIMLNCVYAGMYASKYLSKDTNLLLSIFEDNNITKISDFVESELNFDGRESFVTMLVAKGLVQDIFNDNVFLYDRSTAEGQWEYYKDVACVMFELGALYYNNR